MPTTPHLQAPRLGYVHTEQLERVNEKRGTGSRIKVSPCTKIPAKWEDFFNVSGNKREFFAYLTTKTMNMTLPVRKKLIITGDCQSLSCRGISVAIICIRNTFLVTLKHVFETSSFFCAAFLGQDADGVFHRCDHEEADTRIVVHLLEVLR